MISIALALALQVTPQASKAFEAYAYMQVSVAQCSQWVDPRDAKRISAEADAMPSNIKLFLADMRSEGYVRQISYDQCERILPKIMRDAKARLDYVLLKPTRDATLDYINAEFGK